MQRLQSIEIMLKKNRVYVMLELQAHRGLSAILPVWDVLMEPSILASGNKVSEYWQNCQNKILAPIKWKL